MPAPHTYAYSKMNNPNAQEIYRRIIRAAGSIVQATGPASRNPEQASPELTSSMPRVSLPLEPPIREVLLDDGIPAEAAEKLASMYARISKDLRVRLEKGFRGAWTKVAPLPRHEQMLTLDELGQQLMKTFGIMYQQKLDEWAKEIRESAISRVAALPTPSSRSEEQKSAINEKSSFNRDYLPVLEAYFAKNQHPNRIDKEFLARKSCMSYRQIHVWFQNRRSRAKKAQSVVFLKDDGEIEGNRWTIASSSRTSSVTLVGNELIKECISPSHAFPQAYPPNIPVEEDPFPCRFGDFSCFAKPRWVRRPASILQVQQHVTDLDRLTSAFEKLRIGEATQTSLQKKSNRSSRSLQVSPKGSACDVTSPYTVRPLRAPLVSLIRNFAFHMVHRSGKPSDGAQRLQREVVAVPVAKCSAQSAPRKTRCCQTPASRGSDVSANQNSAPSAYSSDEHITSSAHNSSSAASARASSTDQASKIKKSTKKSSSSRRVPAASASKRSKARSAPVQAVEPSVETSTSHPSPTASVESLPSLSYSSGSSSVSSYSQSPTTSFASLSDDGFLPSLDLYQPSNSSLTLPSTQGHFDDFPPPMFASSSEIALEFSKGPLDPTFSLGLPTYPSYSESFDSISRGLQSSPDFTPPALTLDLPSFAD